MSQIGIFFGGKDNGSTAKVARKIQELLGDQASVHNVASAAKHDVTKYDFLVLGTAAWGIGEMHSDWERFIDTLIESDLAGKKLHYLAWVTRKCIPKVLWMVWEPYSAACRIKKM